MQLSAVPASCHMQWHLWRGHYDENDNHDVMVGVLHDYAALALGTFQFHLFCLLWLWLGGSHLHLHLLGLHHINLPVLLAVLLWWTGGICRYFNLANFSLWIIFVRASTKIRIRNSDFSPRNCWPFYYIVCFLAELPSFCERIIMAFCAENRKTYAWIMWNAKYFILHDSSWEVCRH